jgi:hypothetical protein
VSTFWYRIRDGEERSIEVSGDEIRIGRDPSCSIHVPSDEVEAQHCRVFRTPVGWTVSDEGKTRLGTYVVVLGEALPKLVYPTRALEPGDQILIGHLSEPRFRGWFEDRPRSARTIDARDTPSPQPVPAPLARSSESDAELERLRSELAVALRERDAFSIERDRLVQDRAREISRIQHDYERALSDLQFHVAAQSTQIKELKEDVARLTGERKDFFDRYMGERGQREKAMAAISKATADANEVLLLAEKRAVIIEEQSGQVAVLDARLAEKAAELKNREAEITRLKAMLGTAGSRRDE